MNLSIAIDKLMIWSAGSWVQLEKHSRYILKVYHDQLFIIMNDKVVETFNMNGKIKGVFKNDILILIASNNLKEIRKIKFQIQSNVYKCLQKLGQCFPIINHESKTQIVPKIKYRNLDEVFKKFFDAGDLNSGINLPNNYNHFVKLCLLDPSFNDLVKETHNILNEQLK